MNDDIYKNLVTLLKLFKNRPYHLAKYLVDNNALDKNFIKLLNTNKIKELSSKDDVSMNFDSIEQMDNFYSSLIDVKGLSNKTTEQLEEKLSALAFKPCGSHDEFSVGWVSPIGGKDAPLVHSANNCMMICT